MFFFSRLRHDGTDFEKSSSHRMELVIIALIAVEVVIVSSAILRSECYPHKAGVEGSYSRWPGVVAHGCGPVACRKGGEPGIRKIATWFGQGA